MRLRNVCGAAEVIAASGYVCHQPELRQGKWNSFFQNENPIHIEIGTGKGKFITKMAELNPAVNYIGIEKYASVLYRAVQRIETTGQALANLTFICMDARDVTAIFGAGEVGRIYLNFSDPWPKDRHAKRRLPSRNFMQLFDTIMTHDGRLEFKTDNEELFCFGMDEVSESGWQFNEVTHDLHRDPVMAETNIMTEYEEKFTALGHPIFKYVISR